jgi:hypothetical protein
MSTRARQRRSLHGSGSGRRFAWVLALALLLPFAQAVAWSHAISHHGSLAQRSDAGAPGQFDSSCATCLGAAPLLAGAMPAAPLAVVAPPRVDAPSPAVVSVAVRHRSTLAYRSRAPPLALT